jgi:hypothetical protein
VRSTFRALKNLSQEQAGNSVSPAHPNCIFYGLGGHL